MTAGLEWARSATVSDLAQVRVLWDRAVDELGERRGGKRLLLGTTSPPELEAEVRASTEPGRILVVGGIDDVVLGFADASLDRAGPVSVALLRAAYVEEGARGVGIGEAMIQLVTEWAVEQGCSGIDAHALPGSRSAKAFLEDHGFVTRLLTMYRPLTGGGGDDG